MQVFIKRSDLMSKEAIRVAGYCEDAVAIDPDAHGADMVVLSLSRAAIVHRPDGGGMVLRADWREANRERIAAGEAERRIFAAFPEYSQRNSMAELIGYIASLGANSATWPREAQQRKAEIDRAWAYVAAVRRASNGMLSGTLPGDPTADGNWPTRTAAYKSA